MTSFAIHKQIEYELWKVLITKKVAKKETLDKSKINDCLSPFRVIMREKCLAWEVLNGACDSDEKLMESYKIIIMDEMKQHCNETIATVDQLLLVADNTESKVRCWKMAGDFCRAISRRETRNAESWTTRCKQYYETAWDMAQNSLCACDHVLLEVALSLSKLYYDSGQVQEACKLAYDARVAAIEDIFNCREDALSRGATFCGGPPAPFYDLEECLRCWTGEESNENEHQDEE
ncbi:hypothetical protein RFI_28142 [Reticulomyxa filosa]|uniref:14-3-3 domain-containing protein n=1 Tax=Reticulomyxa filosa TaxID=46433 RepID=X6M894_RETFI|nr:hypothetical protein RFI_28142 [Reticulomyxa filosa]|eukprot:ETO09245.1 hypothetical protein RFI_28142 [Reticulomyxa filosa]